MGRASFPNSTFTLERWRAMAATSPYRRARCLVAYDDDGNAVAATTVWSAGRGRPGLIEPLGVHRDHRGCGHGRAITVAAAAALRQLGSSSATVCTPSSNVGGVAAYMSAGFEKLTEVTDFRTSADPVNGSLPRTANRDTPSESGVVATPVSGRSGSRPRGGRAR